MLHGTRDFSEMENRTLATWPEVTWHGIITGDVQDEFERAASDQISGRDLFVKVSTGVRHALGENDIGDVYIGNDGRYLEKVRDEDISEKRLSTNISVVEKLAADNPGMKTSVFLAPTNSTVGRELLPKGAYLYDDKAVYSKISKGITHGDVIYKPDSFSPEDYFLTDHHWNTDGAKKGSMICLESMGDIVSQSAVTTDKTDVMEAGEINYDHIICDEKFFGTLYSKAPLFSCEGEDFSYPVISDDIKVAIDGKKAEGIYDGSFANKKDKYAIYFGGNFGKVEIINPHARYQKTLLMVKDSFANSAIPYLYPFYKKIVMIDLRYYNEPFSRLIADEDFDELLFFYEMSDFFEDENFSKLLR